MKNTIKEIRFIIEYIIIKIIFFILSLIPMNLVSFIGGKIFKYIGPFSKYNNIAISNYKKIFPFHSKSKIEINIIQSWENIGKTIFEIPILKKIIYSKNKRIEIDGFENISHFLKNKKPIIFFGIHQSNWEICTPMINQLGFNVGAIYRHINNKYIDKIIFNKRTESLISKNSFYTPKGKKSAKDILEAVKQNKSIFLLIDQKDSAGESVNFFDYAVKTQTGFLKIAKKYKMHLIPVQNIRKKNNNFSLIFHKSIDLSSSNLSDKDQMKKIHKIIEKWIIGQPEQWFWQHNRFN